MNKKNLVLGFGILLALTVVATMVFPAQAVTYGDDAMAPLQEQCDGLIHQFRHGFGGHNGTEKGDMHQHRHMYHNGTQIGVPGPHNGKRQLANTTMP